MSSERINWTFALDRQGLRISAIARPAGHDRKRISRRCATAGVETAFIDPGSPWQNGYAEAFNAQFRREQLTGEIIDTLDEAKYLADEWKQIYNHERPHGSLDGMTPSAYWENWTAENQLAIA